MLPQIRIIPVSYTHLLEAAVRSSTAHAELLDSLTTVRYPRARMRRLAMDAALDYSCLLYTSGAHAHLRAQRKEHDAHNDHSRAQQEAEQDAGGDGINGEAEHKHDVYDGQHCLKRFQ